MPFLKIKGPSIAALPAEVLSERVENLEALVEELKKNGVTIVGIIETYDYGKFVHILDVEGNKVQLWEPKD